MLRTNHIKRSQIQEKRAAKDYSGSVTPGSGNGWIHKADVHSQYLLVECKTTTKKSYSIKEEDFMKLYYQAIIENKLPVFEIEFAESGRTLIVLDKNDFLANIDAFSS